MINLNQSIDFYLIPNIVVKNDIRPPYLVVRQSCVGYISKVRWVPPSFFKLRIKIVIGKKERPEKHVVPAEYLFTVGSQSLVLLVLRKHYKVNHADKSV